MCQLAASRQALDAPPTQLRLGAHGLCDECSCGPRSRVLAVVDQTTVDGAQDRCDALPASQLPSNCAPDVVDLSDGQTAEQLRLRRAQPDRTSAGLDLNLRPVQSVI